MVLTALTNTALTLASAIFAACVPIVVMKVNAMFKLNLDQTHRAALSNAIQAALNIGLQAVASCGMSALAEPGTREAALRTMVNYVKEAAPEAIAHLNLSDQAIAETIASHLATALDVAGVTTTALNSAKALVQAAAPAVLAAPSAPAAS